MAAAKTAARVGQDLPTAALRLVAARVLGGIPGFQAVASDLLSRLGRMNVSLYQAASALDATSRWQEVISENLASSPVPGFRKQEVSFTATSAGVRPGVTSDAASGPQHLAIPQARSSTSFQAGEMKFTGEKTHLAIDGRAFFEVQLPNGDTAYTRDGEFQINNLGQLVTKQGYPVMSEGGPIVVDMERSDPLSISAAGDISQGAEIKGKLKLTAFEDESLLTQIGSGMFVGNDPALETLPASGSTVRQGWLEGSNASVVGEMANLLVAMRTYEANQRVIQLHDERMGKTISELTNS
jgi:flagellar basal body rod protein FlgG